jgi:hypothetical protein
MKAKSVQQALGQFNQEDVYIRQAISYYQKCYLVDDRAQLFVKESPRIPDELRLHAQIGLCNRTMGLQIPKRCTYAGGPIRGGLQHMGIITETGHELFRSCIVFPEIDECNNVISIVGYRFGDRIRGCQKPIIYWKKPPTDSYHKQAMALIKEIIYGKA